MVLSLVREEKPMTGRARDGAGVMKKLRLAWRFCVWPWRVPREALMLSLKPLTLKDIQQTRDLAARFGWKVTND
jgi:hypothetical protein